MIDYLVRGVGDAERLDRRCNEAQAEEAALRSQLRAPEASPVGNIELHPAALDRFLKIVEELRGLVIRNVIGGSGETAGVLRELVDCVIVHPPQEGAKAKIEVRAAWRPSPACRVCCCGERQWDRW